MTREIKFRAWNKSRKEMCIVDRLTFMFETENGILAEVINDGEGNFRRDVMPEHLVLMQFTGLKDKNGRDIYEGDLMLTDDVYHDYEDGVAINELPDGKIHPVEFRDGAFFVGDELLCEFAKAWEVIGNVYENPELLK